MRGYVPGTLVIVLCLTAASGCSGELIPAERADAAPANTADASEATELVFRPTVHEQLRDANCLLGPCHASSAVPMTLKPHPTSESDWEANFEEVRARAGSAQSSPLIDYALGANGHIAMPASDPRIDAWRAWIAAGAPYIEDGSD